MEVELKIPLNKSLSDINFTKHLSAKFGTTSETITQLDIYFKSATRNFWLSDEALRLRQIHQNGKDRVEMTYKGPKIGSNLKVREEITIEVSDHDKAKTLLENIGFQVFASIKKIRTNWYYQNILISLDKVEDLGTYIEIEASTSNNMEEIDKIKNKIIKLVKEIVPNYNGQDERRSYLELKIQKGIEDKEPDK